MREGLAEERDAPTNVRRIPPLGETTADSS